MADHKLNEQEVRHFLGLNSKSRRNFMKLFGASAAAFNVSACTPPRGTQGKNTKTKIPGSESDKLQWYNWSDVVGETTLDDFQAQTGVKITMSLFATNDELFSKFVAGNSGYDLTMPSNEFVTRMSQADMLMRLDHSKIPNIKNLMTQFRSPAFDPGLTYAIPYAWLVMGIGYRKSEMKNGEVPDSWRYLFESDAYKGKISLLSESADIFRLGFKYLGKSVNVDDKALIAQIEAMLKKQKPNIKNFHNDDGQDLLLSREVDLVLEYNGDIAQKQLDDDDIAFVVPKEGSLMSTDCMCIPKGASNPNNAHAFINFVLGGGNGAHITKTIQYPTTDEVARNLMDDTYKSNSTIFPPADVMAKCEYGRYQDAQLTQAFEAAMTRLRAF